MISDDLALALRESGVRWQPNSGDRFRIMKQALTEEIFTVSDMVIEEHHHEGGNFFGFNGTTEWALDSVPSSDTLWLPREDQLRTLLGGAFRSLTAGEDAYVVVAFVAGHAPIQAAAADVADAYALAVLELVRLSAT
ncbi:MAG: pilus assembly protein CpaE [Beutenbergiaceae bacterium]